VQVKRAAAGRCNHYTGTQNAHCEAGVCYADVTLTHEPARNPDGGGMATRSIPCLTSFNAGGATCDRHEMPTPEQIAAHKAETDRRLDFFRRGLSPCCEVPIDESQVIQSGRHKGHGSRYCSKCGELLFMV
jgi:hypothetical protein